MAVSAVLVACGGAGTDASASRSPSTSSPAVSASTSQSPGPTPLPTATARPSAGAQPSAEAGAWVRTDSFDADPGSAYVVDVAAWDQGFVAIGSAWPDKTVVAGPEMPALWTSVDGAAWEARPIDLGVTNLRLVGIAPIDDGGGLLVVGHTSDAFVDAVEPGPMRSYAWVSEDATVWVPLDLALSTSAPATSFDSGPQGYVLTVNGAIWFSPDGRDWEQTFEDEAIKVVAGDEGFVAVLRRDAQGERPVVASADGRVWYDALPVDGTVVSVAPLDGDWLAAVETPDLGFTVWLSPDGLEWTQVLHVDDLTGPDGPKSGRGLEYDSISGVSLVGATGAGHAFITLTGNHCCAQLGWNLGVYTTTDGRTWSAVPAAAMDSSHGALVAGIAVAEDGTRVLGGHIGRGDDALFWIGQR